MYEEFEEILFAILPLPIHGVKEVIASLRERIKIGSTTGYTRNDGHCSKRSSYKDINLIFL